MSEESTAIATTEAAPLVAMDAGTFADALSTYRHIQAEIDRAFPDCIMNVRGKQFRKKSYWRAVSTAANLSVEIIDEREHTDDNGGRHWIATARATAPNGRTATGDGACSASEKSGSMCSLHNIRAHALTRAKNRAISDLVGFGEVSAEELSPADWRAPARPAAPAPQVVEHGGPAPETRSPEAVGWKQRRDLKCPRCSDKLWDNIAERAAGKTSKPPLGCNNRDSCGYAVWSVTDAIELVGKMDAGEVDFEGF
jgi:hypothetical protein